MTGYLADIGDIESIAAKSLAILFSEDKQKRMQLAAKEAVRSRFSSEIVSQYETLYLNTDSEGRDVKSPLKEGIGVLEALEEHGHQAYFVGGCIRDFVMKRSIHDIDIATSATPEEVIQIFDKTVPTGLQHGTVLVLFNQSSYEVTTFRSEGTYQDFRRPSEVTFIRDLNEDLQRRDFTMNAMAMDRHGLLYDPFDGQAAIERKEILAVGNAEERFMEDPLRMMRAFVFQLYWAFRWQQIQRGQFNALQAILHIRP